MLLNNLDLLSSDPRRFFQLLFLWALSMAVAITVHEFSHAFAAYKRGDDTAAKLGRLSLNPIVHLDVIGTILLLVAGFGWGKPVPVNGSVMKEPKRVSWALVSVAGVTANLLVAAILALIVRIAHIDVILDTSTLGEVFFFIMWVNVVLAVFNLIPLPPLDGFGIVSAALPESVMRPVAPVIRYSPMIFMGLLLLGSFLPIFGFIDWPIRHILAALLGVPAQLL